MNFKILSAFLFAIFLAQPLVSAADAWTVYTDLPRTNAGGAALDGLIFIVGGEMAGPMSTVRAVNPKTKAFVPRKDLPSARTNLAVVAYQGHLYAIGGSDGTNPLSAVDEYDPKTDLWRSRAPLGEARFGLSAAVINGVIYAVGGVNEMGYSSTVEAYDPRTNKWVKKTSMLAAVETHQSAVVIDGKLYLIGGKADSCLDRVQVYDPRSDSWAFESKLPTGACLVSATVVDNVIYGFSGLASHGLLMVHTLGEQKWTVNRLYVSFVPSRAAVASNDGLIYMFGGQGFSYNPKTDFEMIALREAAHSETVANVPAKVKTWSSEVDLPKIQADPHPNDFALIIGIENYKNVAAAEFAERDSQAFRQYAKATLGVPDSNIISLTGNGARKTDIAKYVEEWLPRNAEPDSRVYVYFSGHGAPDPVGGAAYLVPWDGDPAFLASSAYPISRLYEKLEALKAKTVIVALDACFSGAGGRSVSAQGLRPLVNVTSMPISARSRLFVLTAAKGNEVAGTAEDQGHGLFTYYLLKGLRGDADTKKLGHISLRDLHEYILSNVEREAHRQNRDQTPQLFSPSPALRLY